MGCASWRESSRRGPLDLCRTFSLPVQRTPQSVRRHSDVKPLLLGPFLPRETLIGRVFLGAADVEASAIVRVGERVGDVGVLTSRDGMRSRSRIRSGTSAGRTWNPAAASSLSVRSASSRRMVAHPASVRSAAGLSLPFRIVPHARGALCSPCCRALKTRRCSSIASWPMMVNSNLRCVDATGGDRLIHGLAVTTSETGECRRPAEEAALRRALLVESLPYHTVRVAMLTRACGSSDFGEDFKVGAAIGTTRYAAAATTPPFFEPGRNVSDRYSL